MLLAIVGVCYFILTYLYNKNNLSSTADSQLIALLFPLRKEESVQLMDSRSSVGVPIYRTPHGTQKDKFADLLLNDIVTGDKVDPEILRQYNCYFNTLTKQNLTSGAITANNYYVNNSASIASKLNALSTNIDTLMIQLNNDILTNIGENYARAHLLNRQREEMKKTLDDLPLKNI